MSEYEFLWLEEIESKRSLAWVKEQNTESLNRLQNDPRYEELRTSAERLFTSDDRIPLVTHSNGMVHNFWQDTEHIKGIWRTTSMTSYTSENPDWQTILDIDALAEEEDEDWVYKGRVSLGPLDDRCMVMLSRGGSDATEMREFSISEEKFVMGGFFLKEAKSTVDWLDEDHLLVATDFGPGSLSTSGYPIIVKKWQRGTRISDATTIFTGDKSNMMVVPETRNRPEDRYPFLFRLFEFFQQEIYFLSADGLIRVPLPDDVVLVGVFQDLLICELRSDWQVKQQTFAAGSLVSVDMQASLDQGEPVNPELVFSPPSSYAIKNTSLGRDAVFISTLEDVDGALLEFRRGTNGWHETRVALPAKGSINIVVNDPVGDITMVNYESFLTPSTLYLLNQGAGPQAIKSMPDQFDASGYKSSQLFA